MGRVPGNFSLASPGVEELSDVAEVCTTGELTIECSAVVVKAELQFLYTVDYVLDLKLSEHPEKIDMCYHALVYALAFRYDLTRVMTFALRRFAISAAVSWDHVRFVAAFAYAYEDRNNTFITIRKELVGLAAEHAVELYTTATCSREFIAAVQKYGAFAADLNATLVVKLKMPLSAPAGAEAKAAKSELVTTKDQAVSVE
ncbi:hypothetical protein LTR95_003591 [Oleoguttula sp. CCFEE 5521]